MTLPANVKPDGFGPVESTNPLYWQELNEMGKRGELPERIWPKEPWTPKRKSLLGE